MFESGRPVFNPGGSSPFPPFGRSHAGLFFEVGVEDRLGVEPAGVDHLGYGGAFGAEHLLGLGDTPAGNVVRKIAAEAGVDVARQFAPRYPETTRQL